MYKKKLFFFATTMASLFIYANVAIADDGSDNANVNISLTIKDGCNFSFDKDVDFGSFNFLKESRPATGRFTIKCSTGYIGSEGKNIPVKLGGGQINTSDTPAQRWLYLNGSNSDNRLSLQIYRDPKYNVIWGEDTSNQYYVNILPGSTTRTAVFYALLPEQSVKGLETGEYSNQFHATVVYPPA